MKDKKNRKEMSLSLSIESDEDKDDDDEDADVATAPDLDLDAAADEYHDEFDESKFQSQYDETDGLEEIGGRDLESEFANAAEELLRMRQKRDNDGSNDPKADNRNSNEDDDLSIVLSDVTDATDITDVTEDGTAAEEAKLFKALTKQQLKELEAKRKSLVEQVRSIGNSKTLHEIIAREGLIVDVFPNETKRATSAPVQLPSDDATASVEAEAAPKTEVEESNPFLDHLNLLSSDTLTGRDLSTAFPDQDKKQKELEAKRAAVKMRKEQRRQQIRDQIEQQRQEFRKQVEEEQRRMQERMLQEMQQRQEEALRRRREAEEAKKRVLEAEMQRLEAEKQRKADYESMMRNQIIMQKEERRMRSFLEREQQQIHDAQAALAQEEQMMREYVEEERRRAETEKQRRIREATDAMRREEQMMRTFLMGEKRRAEEEKRRIEEQARLELLQKEEMEREIERRRKADLLDKQKNSFIMAERNVKWGQDELKVTADLNLGVEKGVPIVLPNTQHQIFVQEIKRWQQEELGSNQAKEHVKKTASAEQRIVSDSPKADVLPEDCAVLDEGLLQSLYPDLLQPQESRHQLSNITINVEHISSVDTEALGRFSQSLESLSLDQNELTSLHSFPQFSNLRSVSLRQNRINSLDSLSEKLSHAGNLLEFSAEQNEIRDVNDATSSQDRLKNLRSLNLRNNQIDISSMSSTSESNILNHASRLQSLNILHNSLRGDLQWNAGQVARSFDKIQELDLAENDITSIRFQTQSEEGMMTAFPLLQDLGLYRNNLQGDLSDILLTGNVLLKELLLGGNQLASISVFPKSRPSIFAPLLQVLKLDSNGISVLDEHCFSMLVNLTSLDLSFNRIASLDTLRALRPCRSLIKLKLNDNPVCDQPGYLECILSLVLTRNFSNLADVEIDTDLQAAHKDDFRHWARQLRIFQLGLSPHLLAQFMQQLNQFYEEYRLYGLDDLSSIVDDILESVALHQESLRSESTVAAMFSSYRSICQRQLQEYKELGAALARLKHFKVNQNQLSHSRLVQQKQELYDRKEALALQHYEQQLAFRFEPDHIVPTVVVNREFAIQRAEYTIRSWLTERVQAWKKKRQQRKDAAATRIQKIFRGILTRRRELPWILKELHRRHVAAVRIQKVFRGWFVRMIFKKAKEYNARQMAEIDRMFDQELDQLELAYMDEDEDGIGFTIDRERLAEHTQVPEKRMVSEVNPVVPPRREEQRDSRHYSISQQQDSNGRVALSPLRGLDRIPKDVPALPDIATYGGRYSGRTSRDRMLLPPIRESVPSTAASTNSRSSSDSDYSDASTSSVRSSVQRSEANTSILSDEDSANESMISRKLKKKEEELIAEWDIKQESTAESFMRRKQRFEKMKKRKQKRERLQNDAQLRLEQFRKMASGGSLPKPTQKTVASQEKIKSNQEPYLRDRNQAQAAQPAQEDLTSARSFSSNSMPTSRYGSSIPQQRSMSAEQVRPAQQLTGREEAPKVPRLPTKPAPGPVRGRPSHAQVPIRSIDLGGSFSSSSSRTSSRHSSGYG